MLSCLYRQVCLLCIGFLVLDGAAHQALVQTSLPPGQLGTLLTEQDPTQFAIEKLLDQSEQLRQSGKYDQALPLAQQAVEESEKNLGSAHPLLATSLNLLAEIYRSKGDYAQAEPLYQRSLKIKEKVFGADHLEVATSLHNLGTLYKQKGDLAQAEPLYIKAMVMRENTLGPDHLDVAKSLNNLGTLYKDKGDYGRAEPLLVRSVTIYEKALGPNHPDVATSLNNLATIYLDKGDYVRAEALSARALTIFETAFGANHPIVAQNLHNLAELYRAKGDYAQAEPLLVRSLAIFEKALGPEHPYVAYSLNNLALICYFKGDYARAEPLYRRALVIFEKTLGADHPNVAHTLNCLALLYNEKGDYAHAAPLYERSLAISEKALGADHPEVAYSLNNVGMVYTSRGDYPRAEPLFVRALAIYEKVLGADHRSVAYTLNNLAVLNKKKGDFAQAESFFVKSAMIREKALGSDHPDVAQSFTSLAGVFLIKNDINQAVLYQSRANEVSERDLARNLVSGSERQKLLYLKQTAKNTDITLSLNVQSAPQNPDALKAALTVVLRRKGRALDALTSEIETLRRQKDPQTQKLLDDYAGMVGQISALTLRGPDKKQPADHLAFLRSLEEQKEKLENEIGQRSKEFQAQTVSITVDEIQKLIPPDAVLVEYAVYQPYDPKTEQFGNPRYVVYTLNHQGIIKFADLGETEPIDQLVTRFRQLVSRPKAKIRREIKPVAQALDRLIIKPVLAVTGPATHLLISPDGDLSLIPFAALIDDNGKFLLEKFRLTYLTSGRDLLRLAVKIESGRPPLIMADPDYSDGLGPILVGKQYAPLSRLFGTKVEALSLKNLFPEADLKMQDDATKQALKTVHRPEILHIGTHGRFLDNKLQTVPQKDKSKVPLDAEKLKVENPLLRSWLFFAGANRGRNTESDGILTALEAAQLDLWGTKLVVLSACETAVGETKTGDGVYGLRRALVLAGSESQLMSLWSVSDRGTRDLMIEYYTRLKAGEGRSDALRNVQLKMLTDPKRNHPYYWASFIQSGEWANLAGQRRN